MAEDKLDKIKNILDGGDSDAVNMQYNLGMFGLNMDNSVNQIKKGQLTYAVNAALENFDANSINYQNEPGNEFCIEFPAGYVLIGSHFIQEITRQIFFLSNPQSGGSEIGYMDNNNCQYKTLVNADCLNFNIAYPIHKIVHKITNNSIEIYWTDGFNPRRYLDINNIPRIIVPGTNLCDAEFTEELDCNQLKLQPNFNIPEIDVTDVISGGNNTAGTYQFAIQYADASGNPYTSYYSVTNPTPIADPNITTPNFNYFVGRSIVLNISNLDLTGQFEYFNLAVIKTVNDIASVELVGTYYIDNPTKQITYTGQNVEQIRLSIFDIFEKYPYYDIAQDVTAVQDVLVWDQLSTIDRINYQSIASQITLQWETYKIPADEDYANEVNATNLRGYLRDEVYAFEIVFLLKNGKQTDSFHIPGRAITPSEELLPAIPSVNPDFIGEPDPLTNDAPYWKIYNTATVIGPATGNPIGNATPYQYGEFAYWESEETYPCNDALWGDLAGKPIRHHKFPDVEISPIFESGSIISGPNFKPVRQNNSVYPIGVRLDTYQVLTLIQSSDLTSQQKHDIVGFKIVRGDRGVNKSIVAKGILRNVGEYQRQDQTYYFPNYPYNDLGPDPLINQNNNAWLQQAKAWLIVGLEVSEKGVIEYEYTDINTAKKAKLPINKDETVEVCSLTRPVCLTGKAYIGPGDYDVWFTSGCFGQRGYRAIWSDPFTSDNTDFTPVDDFLTACLCIPIDLIIIDDVFCLTGCDTRYARVIEDGQIATFCSNTGINGDLFSYLPILYDPCQCNSVKELQPFTEQAPNVIDFGLGGDLYNPRIGRRSTLKCGEEKPLDYTSDDNRYRQVFNSPETSFGQPFLGNVLKLESVIFGGGKAHFVEVRNNAKYKLLSKEAQKDALASSSNMGGDPYNATAIFTAYQAYLTIYINGITRKNYAYSFNSIASYDYNVSVPSGIGIKQRTLDLRQYLIPGVQSVGDEYNINNWNRESSVYLRTDIDKTALPFPSDSPNCASVGITDYSRFGIGETGACYAPGKEQDIRVVSYYASMKNVFPGQWGQIYSYDTVDTGYQFIKTNDAPDVVCFFGGDTFISKFAFKTKLPFFIDNRVGAPDDSDIFYDEIGNIGYPKYWHSARSILENESSQGRVLTNFISYKAHNFDCYNDPASIPAGTSGNASYSSYRTFYDGYFYLFAYGIPYFYCESSYNVDLRQAFNNKEGDFWPHVSTSIPDDWVQESFVSIANDNTYYYNVSFSKQNRENTFTHLPPDWDNATYTNYEFRAIYSEPQVNNADVRVNNWLIYRPLSLFDFPKNYGKLVSLDGIQNKAVLARFENKSLMYNNLLTIDTSNPQAAYVGNPKLFLGAPPIDFAETDLGYVGSQNKMLLKIPQGQITVDAKRGQIFLISGTEAVDLTAFGSGVNRFMTDHLAFEILRYFPDIPTDNHFNGIGLHGVYDSKFDRVILTKIDYIPTDDSVKYDADTNEFYIESEKFGIITRTQIYLSDTDFFCNKSWTISFNFNTKTWVSFHTYIPNFYIGENNFFYSGLNGCCSELDGQFGAIVGTDDRLIPTTTTTTTILVTTTTTTMFIDCEIKGDVIEVSCDLAGTAVITVPPTTTTTACARPSGLQTQTFLYQYEYMPSPAVDFTGSLYEACTAIQVLSNTVVSDINLFNISFFTAQATSFEVGSVVYYDAGSTDCTLVPTGFYLTQEGYDNGFVIQIVDGVIVSIDYCDCSTTTTTTTMSPNISECCGLIFLEGNTLKYLTLNMPLVELNVSIPASSLGIAITQYKLWSVLSTFEEWDITLSPFTATYNRSIAFPVGFSISSGIVAIDDETLFCVDDSITPQEACFMDVSGSTAVKTLAFTLPADREAKTNPLITTSGKVIIVNLDSVSGDYYITQFYDFGGVVEIDMNIGTFAPTTIYECGCEIYISDSSSQTYLVTYPDLNFAGDNAIGSSIVSVTQIATCVTKSLETYPFPTTTSTSTLTTTSTTTVP